MLQGKTILILNMYYPPAHPSDFVTKVFLDMIARLADLTDLSVPVAQWLEHCVGSTKVVGSIPREHMY